MLLVVVALILLALLDQTQGLSLSKTTRRDWIIKAPIGAALAYGYGRAFYNTLQNIGIQHPVEHERRVQSTIATTLQAAALAASTTTTTTTRMQQSSPLRILEVGMGTDCRIIRRGLYAQGLTTIADSGLLDTVQLLGVDLQTPTDKVLTKARQVLDDTSKAVNINVDLQVLRGSITDDQLPFDNGYFDAIICCLTLCSVDSPQRAVQEMNRLLRPRGGALGFVEHVAVNQDTDDKNLAWLEQQQLLLDPWQQRLADNCHLHRYTQETLRQQLTNVKLLTEERFLVNAMWPVSMQACGVFQKQD